MKTPNIKLKLIIAVTIVVTVIVGLNVVERNNIEYQKASLRASNDLLIKAQVESVISLLHFYYMRVLSGELSMETAKGEAANIVRELRFRNDGHFWINKSSGENIVSPKLGHLDLSLPMHSYTRYFTPFDWVVGAGIYVDDIYDRLEVFAQEMRVSNLAAILVMAGGICVLLIIFNIASAYWTDQRKHNEEKRLESLVYERTVELNQQYALMGLVNEAAALLLGSSAVDHSNAIDNGMDMLARWMDVHCVYVWQNNRKSDGKLYYRRVYGWKAGDTPQFHEKNEFAYEDTLPRWEAVLSGGGCVNGPVDELPGEEHPFFARLNIQSILAVPIFLADEFWGFVGFDDWHRRRVFPEGEVSILRSWGLLVIGAIQRGEIALNMRNTLTKLETVVKNYKGIIWSVDCNGVITTFNGRYLDTLGVTPCSLEGKELESVFKEYDFLNIVDYVEKTFHEGPQNWIGEAYASMFHSSTMPMYDGEGKVIGVVGSTDDVTEMVKLQRDLETAVKAAEAASSAKSVFLANMSHEIRTPMNAIIGMASIGLSAADAERMKYCFTKIESASKHLLGIINDVLDMSKIEANKFELSLVEFNFEKVFQHVVDVISFRVSEKHQKLTVHIDSAIPRTLIGDDQRLAQVITNLLGNAVKFTPEEGSITLDARFLSENDGICTIQVSVADSGIGISAEQQARLFQPFAQAESSTTRKFGGTGLGLKISKSIVEMMGGEIWIESEFSKGAAFIFTIQVKRGSIEWSTARILAIDGALDALTYLKEILQGFGASCDTATDGKDALRLIEQNGAYDIYFVDWELPDTDGTSLVGKLKMKSGPGAIAVAIMPATAWSDVEGDAKRAGVDRIISKPLFPSVIENTINDCLGVYSKKTKEAQPNIDGLFAGFRVLLAEDLDINREIVQALLEPTLLGVDCAENGAVAVRMFREAPEKYDLIFMDVQMPEMDGYEATRNIRELDAPKAKTIPIVAMTANVFREDIEKCLEAGMNDHIGKPLEFDEVLNKLRTYLPQNTA